MKKGKSLAYIAKKLYLCSHKSAIYLDINTKYIRKIYDTYTLDMRYIRLTTPVERANLTNIYK